MGVPVLDRHWGRSDVVGLGLFPLCLCLILQDPTFGWLEGVHFVV